MEKETKFLGAMPGGTTDGLHLALNVGRHADYLHRFACALKRHPWAASTNWPQGLVPEKSAAVFGDLRAVAW